uniref:NADH-ubiquinone oxidoreductase chain 6 n=1 Tax=Aegosoma sinicum TaxID=2020310 RepID=A0A343ERE5_9CUCU|nr:NADH dehydrogenase subunit 6 [Aegosoma sinicum]ASL05651.1 NADH dehydrogenase subunit 6 [Aegosoma sinicum]
MLTTMLLLSTVTLSIFFLSISHPLSFGLVLLLQTMVVSLITGLMSFNFWFSYILFLIMVGGMLILFIYMTSIASNEKFKFSFKLFIVFILFLVSLLALAMLDYSFPNQFLLTYDLVSQDKTPLNYNSMTKFINTPASFNLTMIIVYLLITLIMVVKITNIQYGPLRQKF